MKKSIELLGTCLLWALLLCALPRAGAYGGQVVMERDIEPLAGQAGRAFTLTTRVWTQDPLGPREPWPVLALEEGGGALDAALERAVKEAEKEGGPVCLVILTGGAQAPRGERALSMQRSVQRVRDLGGRSFVCGGEGWQALSSAPVAGHFFAPGKEEDCKEAARRRAAGAYEAEAVEVLDPRFTLPLEERERLEKEGARVRLSGESWAVAWPIELPRGQKDPWEAKWTVEAKEAFPGGNGVDLCGEGSGVFAEGRPIAGAKEAKVNVGVSLKLEDAGEKIFLGETVPVAFGDGTIEDRMLGGGPQWYGRGVTGTFSYQWEGVGTLSQLGRLKPPESCDYRLRVVFTPKGTGKGSAGPPAEQTAAEGVYRVRVMPGVLRIQVEGPGVHRGRSLAFRVEGPGVSRTVVARPEADPQGGGLTLAAVLEDLPYGKYTVTPGVAMDGKALKPQECLLGVCREDDTVDVSRRFCTARFTLP